MRTVDLSNFTDDGVRVLSGREKGLAVRKDLSLAAHDGPQAEEVTLVIPTSILHVNSSFFLGLIGDSVKELGSAFANRYRINADPRVIDRFRQAVDRVLLTTAPLP